MLKNLKQTDTNSPRPTAQSGPALQTAQPQARNNATSYNAVRSLHRSIGFAI